MALRTLTDDTTPDHEGAGGEPAPAGRPAVGAPLVRRLRVVPWPDPEVEATGVDVLGPYVELFWLPVLGPSATWLLRRLVAGLRARPGGFHVDLDDTAHALGLGGVGGRRSPFRRALLRCTRYGAARHQARDLLAVRTVLGPLPEQHLHRLPPSLREQHRRWEHGERPTTIHDVRRHARSLALHLLVVEPERRTLELRLARLGIHPALAHETAIWARELGNRPSGHAPAVLTPQGA